MKTDGLFANFSSSFDVSQLRKQNATFHVWPTSEHSNEVLQRFSTTLQSPVSPLPQGRCTYDADYICLFKSGMWRRVIVLVCPDISKERNASGPRWMPILFAAWRRFCWQNLQYETVAEALVPGSKEAGQEEDELGLLV